MILRFSVCSKISRWSRNCVFLAMSVFVQVSLVTIVFLQTSTNFTDQVMSFRLVLVRGTVAMAVMRPRNSAVSFDFFCPLGSGTGVEPGHASAPRT